MKRYKPHADTRPHACRTHRINLVIILLFSLAKQSTSSSFSIACIWFWCFELDREFKLWSTSTDGHLQWLWFDGAWSSRGVSWQRWGMVESKNPRSSDSWKRFWVATVKTLGYNQWRSPHNSPRSLCTGVPVRTARNCQAKYMLWVVHPLKRRAAWNIALEGLNHHHWYAPKQVCNLHNV